MLKRIVSVAPKPQGKTIALDIRDGSAARRARQRVRPVRIRFNSKNKTDAIELAWFTHDYGRDARAAPTTSPARERARREATQRRQP